MLVIPVIYAEYEPPPGWLSLTEAAHVKHWPREVSATMMLVFPLVGRRDEQPTPERWLERVLLTEGYGEFRVIERGEPTEVWSMTGLDGLSVEVVGGYARPDAPLEKRTYAVFYDDALLYPFALYASIETHAVYADVFWASARSVGAI